ncbi:hypothetical protein PV762_07235 [Mitsuaria sp. CC2]|uniref:hypothetical protein n=1 Tax=Mitsuaria sp. CC2 TaxID=3029186 RepID=UPI003B8B940B
MKNKKTMPHQVNEPTASSEYSPEMLSPESIRERRKKALYLLPLDAVLLAIGFMFFWKFSHSIADAIAIGEIEVVPRLRHSAAETVPWKQGWAMLLSAGWMSILLIRYQWSRLRFIALPNSSGIRDVDGLLVLSALPAILLYAFSGSLVRREDATILMISVVVISLPFWILIRFGR